MAKSKYYKNRTLSDALWYLKSVFGVSSIKALRKNKKVRKQIEENAKDEYVLDNLIVNALRKFDLNSIGKHQPFEHSVPMYTDEKVQDEHFAKENLD